MPEEILETPQATEPKVTNWPKIVLASVLGLGLLAGSAYAGYYYGAQQVQPTKEPAPIVSQPTLKPTPASEPTPSPTPEAGETVGWGTYTSSKLNFQVGYPPSETVQEGDGWVKFETLNFLISTEPPAVGDPRKRTQVMVVDGVLGTAPVKIYVYKFDSNPQSPEDTNEITVGKSEDTRGWVFRAETPENEVDSLLAVIKQILSTFKFLE